jgi:hypothetical protein
MSIVGQAKRDNEVRPPTSSLGGACLKVPSHDRCDPTLVSKVDRNQAPSLLRFGGVECGERRAGKGCTGEPVASCSQPPPLGALGQGIGNVGVTEIKRDPRLGAAVSPASFDSDCIGKTVQ